MFKNYLVMIFRNFRRNKFFTFLNILGLGLGLTVSLLIISYIRYETSYDRFHANSDRIYRIAVEAKSGKTDIRQTYTPAKMPAALYQEYAEISDITRICNWGTCQVDANEKTIVNKHVLLADTTFFNIFSGEFIYGAPDPSILEPNKVVLSEKMAAALFGDVNPVGQMLRLDDDKDLMISAVVKRYPDNSHVHFDLLVSVMTFEWLYTNQNWFANNFQTYLLLHKNQDYKQLEAKLPYFVDKYLFDGKYSERTNEDTFWELYLQPLTSIHLNSHLTGEFEPNGNSDYIKILGLVAIFIIIIAIVNFINLTTARSMTKAKEIGVRKVIGAERSELFLRFILESLCITFIALGTSFVAFILTIKFFPNLFGSYINLEFYRDREFLTYAVSLGIGVGLASGLYPAILLSSFRPIDIIRNKLLTGKNNFLRNSLVIFQFTISAILFIGAMLIGSQLDYIQNINLGFNKENVLVLRNVNLIAKQRNVLKNKLQRLPGIESVAAVGRMPGEKFTNNGFASLEPFKFFTLNLASTEPEFKDVIDLNVTKGRYFTKDFGTDSLAVVLNEAAVKLIGWDDPIGKSVYTGSEENPILHEVIGVVENIFYESKHNEIQPMAFVSHKGRNPRYLAIRVNSSNMRETVAAIEKVWHQQIPNLPFEYTFFDEDYNALYSNEMQLRKLFSVFTSLAVIIGCLGLIGLTAFITEKRKQEIAVRKVLGATSPGLVCLLSKEFSQWIIIANIIACPIAWWIFRNWLNNFAYRIDISLIPFILSGLITLSVALLTVGWQTTQAALANPVKSLKYE